MRKRNKINTIENRISLNNSERRRERKGKKRRTRNRNWLSRGRRRLSS